MKFVNEGWDDGLNIKRGLKEPGKIKKDHILSTALGVVLLSLLISWEIAVAIGSFIRRLIFRPQPKSLKGRVCLVTGAGRGLGREICLALAREGAVLACVDMNEPNNVTTAAMVKEVGAKAIPYTVNVAIKKDVEEVASRIERELGPVYMLINNAALVHLRPRTDEEFIRASFNVNVFGPIWLMNAVLPTMKMRNEGHIVNISSISTKFVVSPLTVYGSTKMSLCYFGNCVREELHLANKDNIFVTNVHPSIMNSSADYLNMVSVKLNVLVEMEEVVRATMDAIHYNYDDVVVPSILKYPLLLVTQFLPSRTGAKVTKRIFEKWNLPTKEQEKHLPWNALIKQCNVSEKKKEPYNKKSG